MKPERLGRLLAGLALALLTACAGVNRMPDAQLDCDNGPARCQTGRFSVVWTTRAPGEDAKTETLQGRYRFAQGMVNARLATELELGSPTGTMMARAAQYQGPIVLTTARGERLETQDWQTLFDKTLPYHLPAPALMQWFAQPSAAPPQLPAGWQWVERPRGFRLSYQSALTTGVDRIGSDQQGRVDLLPD